MSCNGCRVLRRGCGESCVLRPCLDWIDNPQAQANATLFVSKFFGRSDLLTFIAAVPESKRPALFQSLLFEACGRTINPVNGAVGLLSTGNWQLCQSAVQTVLSGGTLRPSLAGVLTNEESLQQSSHYQISSAANTVSDFDLKKDRKVVESSDSEGSGMVLSFGSREYARDEPKLLNLFQ